ncbi:hypothetical protein M0804_000736 [Polistes exclamans]|nr:hypothetical protein M0804_000736 [Polistes exclamans]
MQSQCIQTREALVNDAIQNPSSSVASETVNEVYAVSTVTTDCTKYDNYDYDDVCNGYVKIPTSSRS